jgi:uncharacterized protein RhaS with RHS repeats
LPEKHYNYFRDYDPSIGRYIESDPIGLEAGLNTYDYVDSRPLSLIDFAGLASSCGCDANDSSFGPLDVAGAGNRPPPIDPKNPPKYNPPKGA